MRLKQDSESHEEMGDEITEAWWAARYYYTNRKKTQVMDRFMWFLLGLWNWTSGATRGKALVKAYKEAFLSPEMEKAIALDNRLEQELCEACRTYIQTIDPRPSVFGISTGKMPMKDETMKRIAEIVAGKFLPGVYSQCAQFAYADVLVRSLWNGAEEVYPGIAEMLEAAVGEYKDAGMREFVSNAMNACTRGT